MPSAAIVVGQYVRVIYDFDDPQAGEIHLQKGDILLVSEVLNKHWLRGRSGNNEGSFPASFVEVMDVPAITDGERLFAAITSFATEETGDLHFSKGDLVVGEWEIDAQWWYGRRGTDSGIFPLTHVNEILQPSMKSKSNNYWPGGGHGITKGEITHVQACALVDSVAQLDEELGFRKGDIITVMRGLGSDWLEGECNGRTGILLSSCVKILDQVGEDLDTNHVINDEDVCDTMDYNSNKWKENITVKDSKRFSSYSTTSSKSEKRYSSGDEDVALKRGTLEKGRSSSYTSENTRSWDSEVTPYGKTLFPFEGENSGELTFMDNDIVTLIQHVDEDWIEGELDGRIGLFPASFVEIIVDCPYLRDNDSSLVLLDVPENEAVSEELVTSCGTDELDAEVQSNQESLLDDKYALVLYDFLGESDDFLSVREGDTVTVVMQPDESWIYVYNDDGHAGYIPLNYAEIIGDEPKETQTDNEVKDESPVIQTSHIKNCTSLSKSDKQIDKRKSADENILIKSRLSIFECPDELDDNRRKSWSGIEYRHEQESCMDSEVHETSASKRSSVASSCSSGTGSSIETLYTLDKHIIAQPKPILKPKPPLRSFDKPPLAPKPKIADTQKKHQIETSLEVLKEIDSLIEKQITESRTFTGKGPTLDELAAQHVQPSAHKPVNENSVFSHITNVNSAQYSSAPAPSMSKMGENTVSQSRRVTNSAVMVRQRTVGQSTFFSFGDSLPRGVSLDSSSVATDPLSTRSESTRQVRKQRLKRKPAPPRPQQSPATLFNNTDHSGKINPSFLLEEQIIPRTVATLSAKPQSLKSAPGRPPSPPGKGAHNMHNLKPSRPAPPPPNHLLSATPEQRAKAKLSAKLSPSDLMEFSPNSSATEIDATRAEAVASLKHKLHGLDRDIQKQERGRVELLQMLELVQGDDRKEVEENLSFFDDQMNGLIHEKDDVQDELDNITSKSTRLKSAERGSSQWSDDEEAEKWRHLEEKKRQQEEKRQQRITKRMNVIEELLCTERDYLHDLQLCVDTFLGPLAEKVPEIDMETLFANMEEVTDVSQRLQASLDIATTEIEFPHQRLGVCFLEFAEDLQNTYAPYCRNHDEVNTLLKKYEEIPAIQSFLESRLELIRQKANVFDLGSLLIKPVQRILKYPLLLNELYKCTEENHPDKKELLRAINAMTDVATAINEYKRRKDLVYKYKKPEQTFGGKIAKLNMHSIMKKSTRIKGRLSTNLGISFMTKDEAFNHEEMRFRILEKTARSYLKEVQNYLDEIQSCLLLEEAMTIDIEDYYSEKPPVEVLHYQQAMANVSSTLLSNFKSTIDDLVIEPMSRLIDLFKGPANVIEKRRDKLIDYDSMYRKLKDVEKSRATTEALQIAKNTYEALNGQLLDELPVLYDAGLVLLRHTIASFVRTQREFTDAILREIYPLLELPQLLSSSDSIMKTFQVRHSAVVDKLSSLRLVGREFNPRASETPPRAGDRKAKKLDGARGGAARRPSEDPQSHSPQSEKQKCALQERYTSDNLYRVIHRYVALDPLDISVEDGNLVGIIKQQDPMGQKDRWFVDNGEIKGFVPAKFLVHCGLENTRASASTPGYPLLPSTPDFDLLGDDIFDIDDAESAPPPSYDDCVMDLEMNPTISESRSVVEDRVEQRFSSSSEPPEFLLYCADFPFQARTTNEASLFEGQVVMVIAKHDLDSNSEWWWVDADGLQGYVPAAYLRKMD